MPASTNPLVEFVAHVSGLHPGQNAAVKAGATPTPACSSADASKLSSTSQAPAGCDIFNGDILPTNQQISACIGKIGVSNSCETCLSNLLSSILTCLNKCEYKDGEISANPNAECMTCMMDMMSTMSEDSNILASCGLDAASGNQLLSDVTDGTTDAAVAGATTTKSSSIVNRSIVLIGTLVALLTMM
jgi:hypothetical protein